jgi:hypothetical protein
MGVTRNSYFCNKDMHIQKHLSGTPALQRARQYGARANLENCKSFQKGLEEATGWCFPRQCMKATAP